MSSPRDSSRQNVEQWWKCAVSNQTKPWTSAAMRATKTLSFYALYEDTVH